MNATDLLVVMACLSAAAMIMAGSGIGAELGGTPETGMESQFQQFEDSVQEFQSDPVDATSILGLAITAVTFTTELIKILLLGPVALMNLGFPSWIAVPMGLPIWVMTTLLIIEILRGVNLR